MRGTSLYRRLLTPVAIAVVFLTLLVTATGMVLMRRAVEERAHRRAAALVPALHDQVRLIMQVGEHRQLQRLIEELAKSLDVQKLRVLRPDGAIVASSERQDIGVTDAAHLALANGATERRTGGFWSRTDVHSVQPIANERACHACHGSVKEVLGFVDIDVPVNPHLTGLTAFVSLSALLGVLYLVAVIGIVVPTLGYVVVRPMRAVIAGFRRVQRGDLQTRLQPAGAGEIDEVVQGFNQMVEQLESAHELEKERLRLERVHAEHLASVGQLAAGLAHEFRNPLSSVKAVVEVLAAEAAPGDANRDVLRAAAGELDRIDQILKDLLHYAKPRQPAKTRFDLNPVVHDVVRLTFPPFAKTGPSVEFVPESALVPVCGDPDMVRQVLTNMLLNAWQAVSANGTGQIMIRTGANSAHAWCSVTDNGPGVSEEFATRLFQPFVTTKTRGAGLGLATSRRLVELLGGSLVLDNPGKTGASFRFTLPLAGPGA